MDRAWDSACSSARLELRHIGVPRRWRRAGGGPGGLWNVGWKAVGSAITGTASWSVGAADRPTLITATESPLRNAPMAAGRSSRGGARLVPVRR